ncbi:MAG TPA: DUF3619 family protein [Accumulibacter sp.]|nr:DUF3619 family protein [Accumulibacter sp.]HMW16947.1 DUF3619 family protein [Accumulibacter sp.]HMX22790.1 DUF3619 family protein [Accumulibacter sp.]HMY05601.1 DUF3619 family protein [Accumulibacter sp.]HNC17414.1 DUF3619 family protein [Accumulibacter sp.]
MNELHFAYKIRQQLNRGSHDVSPSTVKRLDAIRERALSRQRVAVSQSVLAGVGGFFQHHVDSLHLRQVLVALAIAVGIMGYTYWSAEQDIAELEVLDSALLADELPIAAFTDKGFAAWLKSSASR